MEFRKVLALRGPNIWANRTVLEAWVDLQELKDSPSDVLPGFNERVMAWLPTMIEHRCSVGERGGFFERLRRGTWMGHILEHITLELQTLAGTPVGFGRARETSEDGVYKVAIEYKEEELARAALNTAFELCRAAIHDRPFDITAEVQKLRDLAQKVCLGPSTGAIVAAARKRGIPVRNQESLVQLGFSAKQHRILAAETDRTPAIAESVAQDKELTRMLLRTVGVPVPEGRPVTDAADAWEAAVEIGHAVVVKPQYGSQGRGVTTNLTTREQVMTAYTAAREESRHILVERYAPGADYRLLIVGEKVVAAARREPAQVIGDGKSTITQLVDDINRDPRRSDDHATALTKIKLEAIALATLTEQNYTPDSVVPAGEKVIIRRNANLSTGGTATDVTDRVHPEVAARAIEAARVVGLDVAGVDVIAVDISRPLEQQGGVVVEVNAGPGLRMHLEPSAGISRPVGEAIIDSLFGDDPSQNGRIPLVAVTGVNGKTTTTRFIAHLLKTTGRKVGMTCTDGIFIDGRKIDTGDCSGPISAQAVLLNPTVDAAVLETARGGILRAGLGFDLCDVAVVTNIGEGDHLGLHDVETLEKLAKVKRCIVDVVAPHGAAVLKADDPHTAAMAPYCKGLVIFFAQRGDDPVIVAHRAAGGRAIFVRHGMIVLAESDVEIPLVPLTNVPLTHGGRIGFQVENALAAAAAAWALGIPRDVIRGGLESFAGDLDKVPGRFNLLEIGGATVIVDYGHNPSALLALIEALEQFPHERRVCVYSAAGDRRDCDMVRQGELLGDAFDKIILYEDHYLRGREPGEIMGLFRQGLDLGNRTVEVVEITGALKAVETALKCAQPRDLLLIQADVIDETVDYIKRYLELNEAGQEIDLLKAIEVPTSGPAIPASASVYAQIVD